MSDDSTQIRIGADIEDFSAKLAEAEKRLDALVAKAASVQIGGGLGRQSGGGGRGGSAAFRESRDDFMRVADSRNYWAGQVGQVQSDLENTPRSLDRQRLYEQGYTGSHILDSFQNTYDNSIPSRGSRGRPTIADLQEAALREDQRRDSKATADAQRSIERQAEREIGEEYRQRLYTRRDAEREYDEMFSSMRQDAVTQAQARDFTRDNPMMAYAQKGVMVAVGRAAQEMVAADTAYTTSGQANPMAAGAAWGALPGGILGALAGAPFGPWGSMIGAGVGGQIGSAAANSLQAGSVAQNQMLLNNFGYAYGAGNDPRGYLDDSGHRGMLGISQSDERFLHQTLYRQGVGAYAREYAERYFGVYSGNDKYSPQDEQRAMQSFEHMATARGEVLPGNIARGSARGFLEDPSHPGQEALALLPAMERYSRARTAQGDNRIDMLFTLGADDFMIGARANGQTPNARLLTDIGFRDVQNQRDVRIAGYDMARGQIGLETLGLSGNALSGADFSQQRGRIQDALNSVTAQIENLLRDASGDHSEQVAKLRQARDGFILNLAQSVSQQAHCESGIAEARIGIGRGDTALQSARTTLYGGAGDFTGSVLPMEQRDVDREISRQRNIVNGSGFTAEEKAQAMASIRNLQAQRMMLPAQNQAQDIAIAQGGFGAQRAEQGVSAAYAGIYGNVGDLGAVGQSRQGQIAAERSYWQNLRPESRAQEFERRGRLAQLDAEQLQVRAGVASQQIGIEREQFGLRLGAGQYDIARQSAYGSDGDVSVAYGAQRQAREREMAVLSARANDASLPREVRMQAQRDLLNQHEGLLNDAIHGRDIGIGREETRAGLRRGDTEFGLDRARRLGGANDFRSAIGIDLSEIGRESGEITAQLAQGNLTFDQESRLRRRQQGLRRESFDLAQRGIDEGFQREDLAGYDLQRMHRQGALNRSRMLPFGLGNGLALEMGQIGFNNQRLGSLSQREQMLYQTGNLSPERRMSIEREMEGLQTENMEYIGHAARGMEDYLPAMSAGQPSSYGRYNSLNLAALRMGQAGSLAGNFGYAGGAHEAMQQGMLRNLAGGNVGLSGPGGMNSSVSREAGFSGVGELVQAINNLAAIMTRGGMGGGGMRPGEVTGMVYGALDKMIAPGQGKGAQFGR